MDFTHSDGLVVDPGTGHNMHQDTAAVTTAITAADMNQLTWSLMRVLAEAGVAGKLFDPTDPTSYDRFLVALQKLFLSAKTGEWIKDAAGNLRFFFDNLGPLYAQGGNLANTQAVFNVMRRSDGAVCFSVQADGRLTSRTNAAYSDDVPRLQQVQDLIASNGGLGVGQTLQDMTSVRNLTGTFTNPTGKMIVCFVRLNVSGPHGSPEVVYGSYVDGNVQSQVTLSDQNGSAFNGCRDTLIIFVPAYSTYKAAHLMGGVTAALISWTELRT